MNRPLPAPVLRYLREIEPKLKARFGVFVEQVLSDTREFLVNDYDSLLSSEPGLDEDSIYEHFVEHYGTPAQTASQYGEDHGPRKGVAPGWRVCCTRCGKSAPAAELGFVRIGARSVHSYKGVYCSNCGRLRWGRMIRDLEDTNLTDQLAMGRTPEQVLARMHKPWTIVASILLLVGLICGVGTPLTIWLVKRIVTAQAHQVSTEPNLPELLRPVALVDGTPRYSKLPVAWILTKTVSVPATQLPAFSQKLGAKLTRIDNFFFTYRGIPVQVNELECESADSVDALVVALRKTKSNPRLIGSRGNIVFELIARDAAQMKVAMRARNELQLIPAESEYEVVLSLAPIREVEAGEANRLFNLFIALDGGKSAAADEIASRKSQLILGDRIMLRQFGQGDAATEWSIVPEPISKSIDPKSGTIEFRLSDLPLKASIPTVTVKGTITSRTIAATPGDASSAELCLAATPRWPVDSPRIRSLAAEITSGATTDVSKVEMLLNWISDSRHFRFGGDVTGSRYGTLKALDQGYGHCWDYSDVFISLARASGVPARQVHGWLYESEGHIWPEVYIDGQWIAVDPTAGLRCGSDYIPFATSTDGETTYMLASEVKIKRMDASH